MSKSTTYYVAGLVDFAYGVETSVASTSRGRSGAPVHLVYRHGPGDWRVHVYEAGKNEFQVVITTQDADRAVRTFAKFATEPGSRPVRVVGQYEAESEE